MGPAEADFTKVAQAGRTQGELYGLMLGSPYNADAALPTLLIGVGKNLGHAGTFDYQREGSYFGGYIQHREFRDISNVNVGLFMQQAGFSLKETLEISGAFAGALSSNVRPAQPYSLDPRTREFIELGFKMGASGAFGPPRPLSVP